jgi:hypothetical protein
VSRVYKATIRCEHGDGTLVEPGLHYQTDLPAGGSEPDPADVANDIWNQIGVPFGLITPSSVVIHELVVTEEVVPPTLGAAGVHTISGAGSAAAGDQKEPKELVPLINFHTATRSRSARGHSFMAGPMNSIHLAAGGIWESAFLGLLQGFANACLLSFDLGAGIITSVHPVVYSRTRHRAGLAPFTFRLTGATAKPTPTWLRSRGTSP